MNLISVIRMHTYTFDSNMWLRKICFICAFLVVNTQDSSSNEDDEFSNEKEGDKKLSETVLALIEHFKQPDPIGLPGDVVPDPGPVPDSSQSVAFGVTMYFKDTRMYGVSKFHILYINADIERMEVEGALALEALQTRGNYTLSSWFDSTHGSFTINMTGLNATVTTNLGVQIDGQLQVQDVNIDLALDKITTDFDNLGIVGGVFQSILNSGGTVLIDSMKPYMLKEMYTNIRTEINTKLENFLDDMQFPNSIPAIDMVIINTREKIRDMHLDPFRIDDFNKTYSPVTVTLFNTSVSGLSSIQRVGNVTLRIENNTAETEFEIGTLTLEGKTQWDISTIGDFISKDGTASFSVEYISTKIVIAQPLDTRKQPIFKEFHLDVGNIQARCDGLGAMDYVIELVVNILPNLIRYQVVGALEGPLKTIVQEELNKINVEETIKNELPKLDEMQDLKLSDLIRTNMEEQIYDEDEFFNF